MLRRDGCGSSPLPDLPDAGMAAPFFSDITVVFRVEGNRAVVAKTADFLELAGSVNVPAAKRNAAWDDAIRRTRTKRAAARR